MKKADNNDIQSTLKQRKIVVLGAEIQDKVPRVIELVLDGLKNSV